ncbi:hypothetical protein F2Q69_00059480 [Brassica cretica]|uniref:Retrotransposon gag domain-containing protein n=1 Tax=Brassica cretica TaxID=69181 RepID=A0A8S9RJ18_BRACR|nr:hypothetical protein F2Q69_00059480 [Brassica cretica]
MCRKILFVRYCSSRYCSSRYCSSRYCSSRYSSSRHCSPRHCSSDVEALFIRCRGTVHPMSRHCSPRHCASDVIDTVHPTSIDTVHFPSIDIVHPASIDTVLRSTVHLNTVHPNTVHPDTVHPVKNDTTCRETEKIEVLILKVDENEMLRDEEGRIRNSAGQFINAQGAVIPDVIVVAEMNDFDLSREWYDWVGQDSFQGLPHQDPRNHIEELEDLVSRGEHNEVFEYHMLGKIFPYSISGNAFSWFSQLQPGSLTSWDDIERAFLYKFLDDVEATREKEKYDKWDRDEQHGFGEPSKGEEAETSYWTSTSNDTSTSTSIDGTISTSTDDKISTSIDITTSSSIDSGRVSEQKEFDVCENLGDGDTHYAIRQVWGIKRRNWKKRKRIKDGPQRECPSVLLEDKQKEFELVFQQCHWFEFNQHPVAEVMLVLLKSSQSASREEAVEEMKD